MINLEYIIARIYYFFVDEEYQVFDPEILINDLTSSVYFMIFNFFWGFLAVFFVLALGYYTYKTNKLFSETVSDMNEIMANTWSTQREQAINEEWEKVTMALDSPNESDWKLAIIEADNMLDTLVKKMGYEGENLGERLKGVEPSDFLTLNDAWEAHKVRNAIAHEQGFKLSRHEATRVIGLYKKVFDEFEFI